MPLISINPFTGEVLANFKELSEPEILQKIQTAEQGYRKWSKSSLQNRLEMITALGKVFQAHTTDLSSLISLEMGCPISQSVKEIEKCVRICQHYVAHTHAYLESDTVRLGSGFGSVRYDPLGVILHVAPWNYPVYLAIRPAILALIMGNVCLVKHSSNVPQVSQRIEQLFEEAGFEKGIYTNLHISSQQVEPIIRHPAVKMVTLIGSEYAGSKVAAIAGEELKKVVLELGGSDAFIVFPDADLRYAAERYTYSRLRNAGQSCNAAKRLLLFKEIHDEFLEYVIDEFQTYQYNDPQVETTKLGPLGTKSSQEEVTQQVSDSVKSGAAIAYKANDLSTNGYYYPPTILTQVTDTMQVFTDEVFGPVAAVMPIQSLEEAILKVNQSKYGLGTSVWTRSQEIIESCIPQLDVGNVFVNRIVRSDPALPFGGVKRSGFGREFGSIGLLEFANIKTVVIDTKIDQ